MKFITYKQYMEYRYSNEFMQLREEEIVYKIETEEKSENLVICSKIFLKKRSGRSVHSLRWAYEHAVAAGIQPIAKGFRRAGYLTAPCSV